MAPWQLALPFLSLPPILYMQYRIPVSSWSKAPWGLSVLAQVTSIFTGTSISPDALSRQRSNHYAFRAGRNLPDKEFRYLRDRYSYGRRLLGLQFKASLALTSPLNLPAPGRRQPIYLTFRFCIDLCFAKQLLETYSLRPHFCGTLLQLRGHLPSSLTMLLPSALGFSPHPPVSVYGTGTIRTIAAFLDAWLTYFPTRFRSPSRLRIALRFFLQDSYLACTRLSIPRLCSPPVPTVLSYCSTGISTCCPSATTLVLALGPDLPRADQLYPETLDIRPRGFPPLSLLIPAFSLRYTPQLLPVLLRCVSNAPLPMSLDIPQLRCRVSAPDIFGAGPLDQ